MLNQDNTFNKKFLVISGFLLLTLFIFGGINASEHPVVIINAGPIIGEGEDEVSFTPVLENFLKEEDLESDFYLGRNSIYTGPQTGFTSLHSLTVSLYGQNDPFADAHYKKIIYHYIGIPLDSLESIEYDYEVVSRSPEFDSTAIPYLVLKADINNDNVEDVVAVGVISKDSNTGQLYNVLINDESLFWTPVTPGGSLNCQLSDPCTFSQIKEVYGEGILTEFSLAVGAWPGSNDETAEFLTGVKKINGADFETIKWRVAITGPESEEFTANMVELDEVGWEDQTDFNIETFHYPLQEQNGALVALGSCDDPDPEHSDSCTTNIGFSLVENDNFENADKIKFSSNAPDGIYTIAYELVDTLGTLTTDDDVALNEPYVVQVIIDTEAPVITVPENIEDVEATGFLTSVNLGTATATDIVDTEVTITNNAPESFPVGTTAVTWNAIDDAGNSITSIQEVTIKDTTAPVISGTPNNIEEITSSLDGKEIIYDLPTAYDLVNGEVNVNCNPSSGSTFPLGNTLVTCTSEDEAGNVANSTFNVHVELNSSSESWDFSTELISNDDGTKSVTIPIQAEMSVDAGEDLGTISVVIPAGTKIKAESAWNGTIFTPTIESVAAAIPAPAGFDAQVTKIIEVGFPNIKLTFDKAVRILIPGETGKKVGYSRGNGDNFHPIEITCVDDTQATNDLLPEEGDCYLDNGTDLIVWTKHFTQFISYSQTPSVSTQNNFGGSGGVRVAPPIQTTQPLTTPVETEEEAGEEQEGETQTTPPQGFFATITGAVIGALGKNGAMVAVIFVVAVVAGIVILSRTGKKLNEKKSKKEKEKDDEK